jgi:hypothetical protein
LRFILADKIFSLDLNILSVLKVLEQLPEGLAIAVLAAAPVALHRQLEILPASLHHLAIEAAFPSIRRHHSLTLTFFPSPGIKPREFAVAACAVLHAAITNNSALTHLEVSHIPVGNDGLVQLISAACKSPSDLL